MKIGELVVVPLMEDAKSLAAFILASADVSQGLAALDHFLSPALLGLPVPPAPDHAAPSPSSASADARPMMMDMPRLDAQASAESLPNGRLPGFRSDMGMDTGMTMEEEAALNGARGWDHTIRPFSSVAS
jgi:hypothetical protein